MKKHIFGLAIFSLIVGAAAFVYGVFDYSEISDSNIKPTISTYSENVSSSVAQAVYSVKTKKLTWQGKFPNEKNPTHFDLWAAYGNRFDYIGSVAIKNWKGGNTYAFDELDSSLRKIAPSVNLYLIAETEDHLKNRGYDSILKFDSQNAVPVTIDYGK